MKNLRKTCLLLVICMMSMFAVSMNAAAISKTEAAEKATAAYNEFIRTHQLVSHVIVDIDNNKIPELLCFDRKDMDPKVYGCNKKGENMKLLCTIHSGKGYGSFYNAKKHVVVLYSCSTGGEDYVVYKISGQKAKKTKTYSSRRQYPGFTYKYKMNKVKITQKKWSSEIAKIRKYSYFKGLMG